QFRFDASGRPVPDGHAVRKPGAAAPATVNVRVAAVAVGGSSQRPATETRMWLASTRSTPAPVRVSASRHGVTGVKAVVFVATSAGPNVSAAASDVGTIATAVTAATAATNARPTRRDR